MPKFPDKLSLGDPGSLRSGRHIVQASDVDASAQYAGMKKIGAAIAGLGGMLSEREEKATAEQNALDLLKAEAAHQRGITDLDRRIESDPDYKSHDQKFVAGAGEVTTRAGEVIRDPKMREKWQLRAGVENERLRGGVLNRTDRLQKEQRQGELYETLSGYRTQYAKPDATPEERLAARKAIDDALEIGTRSGLLGPKEARVFKQEFSHNMALDDIKRRQIDEPEQLLRDLSTSGADRRAPGMLEPGTIDPTRRPIAKGAELRAMPMDVDGKQVLLPTAGPDGRELSEEEAVDLYKKSGQHFGVFDTPEAATSYAKTLSQRLGKKSGSAAAAMITSQLETGQTDPLVGVGQIAGDSEGSKSYGNFGLNSKGSLQEFVKEYVNAPDGNFSLQGEPGSKKFDKEWKALADAQPEMLHQLEMQWFEEKILPRISSELVENGVPQDVANDPRVQAYFADRMVQYGPNSNKSYSQRIKRAIEASGVTRTKGASGDDKPSPEARNILLKSLTEDKGESHVDGMTGRFQKRLATMLSEAPPEVRDGVKIFSGSRTKERQAELFAAAVKKYGSEAKARRYVAPPGASYHNHGEAADLRFDSDAAKEWVHANAQKYGLKFPMGHEPWHIETAETRGGKQHSEEAPAGGELGPVDPTAFLRTMSDADAANIDSDFRSYLADRPNNKVGLGNRISGRERLAIGSVESEQPGGMYPTLSPLERSTFINETRTKLRERTNSMRSEFKQVTESDVESLRRTGKGVDFDIDMATRILEPSQISKWRVDRAEAQYEYEALHDIDNLSVPQIEQRLLDLQPKSGDPQFDVKQRVFDLAEKKLKDVRELRTDDPARSVLADPGVQQAQQAANATPGDPGAQQALVRARLDAQERVGVNKGLQSPVTVQEARTLAARVRGLSGEPLSQAMNELQGELETVYGPYAHAVGVAVQETITRDRDLAERMQGMLRRIYEGKPPTAAQIRETEILNEGQIALRALGMGGDYTSPHAQMGIGRSPDALERGTVQGGPLNTFYGFHGMARPPLRAVLFLQQNPGTAAQFEAKYGRGSASSALATPISEDELAQLQKATAR